MRSKKVISVILVILVLVSLTACGCEHVYTPSVVRDATYDMEGVMSYTCNKCGKSYEEAIPVLTKLPNEFLNSVLSNVKYRRDMFSISVGQLINRAMDGYSIEYITAIEADARGNIDINQIDPSIDPNLVYLGIVSGDVMSNPNIPHMTNYQKEAMIVWMMFDENNQLVNSSVTLCDDLQTCAILLMTSDY